MINSLCAPTDSEVWRTVQNSPPCHGFGQEKCVKLILGIWNLNKNLMQLCVFWGRSRLGEVELRRCLTKVFQKIWRPDYINHDWSWATVLFTIPDRASLVNKNLTDWTRAALGQPREWRMRLKGHTVGQRLALAAVVSGWAPGVGCLHSTCQHLFSTKQQVVGKPNLVAAGRPLLLQKEPQDPRGISSLSRLSPIRWRKKHLLASIWAFLPQPS